jgi:hypothetical protein
MEFPNEANVGPEHPFKCDGPYKMKLDSQPIYWAKYDKKLAITAVLPDNRPNAVAMNADPRYPHTQHWCGLCRYCGALLTINQNRPRIKTLQRGEQLKEHWCNERRIMENHWTSDLADWINKQEAEGISLESIKEKIRRNMDKIAAKVERAKENMERIRLQREQRHNGGQEQQDKEERLEKIFDGLKSEEEKARTEPEFKPASKLLPDDKKTDELPSTIGVGYAHKSIDEVDPKEAERTKRILENNPLFKDPTLFKLDAKVTSLYNMVVELEKKFDNLENRMAAEEEASSKLDRQISGIKEALRELPERWGEE